MIDDTEIKELVDEIAGTKRGAIQDIMRVAASPEEAHELVQYLASLDWKQVFDEERQREIDHLHWKLEMLYQSLQDGEGVCDRCQGFKKLLYWPHDRYKGRIGSCDQRFCWKCLYEAQEFEETLLRKEWKEKGITCPADQILLWKNKMEFCSMCERLIPRKSRFQVGGKRYDTTYYCFNCLEIAAEKQFVVCNTCGKKTVNHSKGMCYNCYDFYAKYPSPWLSSHLERARKAGNPATLTAKEWAIAVEYFGGKCAYCRTRPFEVLEHFLPIILGGGTTAENCLPACFSCNSRKGSMHPNNFDSIFSHEVIEHIKQYLQGDKQQIVSPYVVNSRALVVYAIS